MIIIYEEIDLWPTARAEIVFLEILIIIIIKKNASLLALSLRKWKECILKLKSASVTAQTIPKRRDNVHFIMLAKHYAAKIIEESLCVAIIQSFSYLFYMFCQARRL